jgi:hypothetical protein
MVWMDGCMDGRVRMGGCMDGMYVYVKALMGVCLYGMYGYWWLGKHGWVGA